MVAGKNGAVLLAVLGLALRRGVSSLPYRVLAADRVAAQAQRCCGGAGPLLGTQSVAQPLAPDHCCASSAAGAS